MRELRRLRGYLPKRSAGRQVTSRLRKPASWTRTTCPYCGTGCEMDVGTSKNRIVSIKPLLDAPVSRGHLCVKGRYAFDFVSAPDRITQPMIRKGDKWQQVTWDDAVSFIAESLQRISEKYGPDSIAVLGSARGTNEENYLAQKFARVVIGTNNVDCCARVCHTPTAAAMKLMLGTGAATNSYNDIEKARTILVCGANATENHPNSRRTNQASSFEGREPDRNRSQANRACSVRRDSPAPTTGHKHPAPECNGLHDR